MHPIVMITPLAELRLEFTPANLIVAQKAIRIRTSGNFRQKIPNNLKQRIAIFTRDFGYLVDIVLSKV